jgi:hypothetical protein
MACADAGIRRRHRQLLRKPDRARRHRGIYVSHNGRILWRNGHASDSFSERGGLTRPRNAPNGWPVRRGRRADTAKQFRELAPLRRAIASALTTRKPAVKIDEFGQRASICASSMFEP